MRVWLPQKWKVLNIEFKLHNKPFKYSILTVTQEHRKHFDSPYPITKEIYYTSVWIKPELNFNCVSKSHIA